MSVVPRSHKKSDFSRRTIVFLLGVLLTAVLPAQTTAFRGGDIYTVSDGVFESGVLVVKDGKIIAVGGASTIVPREAKIVDVAGQRIYPGFFQSYSSLGLSEIDSVRGSVDTGELGDNNADVRAEVAVSADSIRLLPAMGGGVLYAHVVPEGGDLAGTSAVLRLDGWNWEDMTVGAPTTLHLNFPAVAEGSDKDDEGAGESKAMQALNQAFDDASDYGAAREAGLRLNVDRKLQRVLDVINGELRLLVHADSAAQIEKALAWTADREIKEWVLLGTTDTVYFADELAERGVPVLLETVLGIPQRDFESYDAHYSAPAKLAAAGVSFAITGQGDSAFARNLPIIAGMAVAYGLDPQVALRSVTLTPAEILGVAESVGSLQVGREASFFLANGNPLEATTQIEAVWVRGLKVDLERDPQRRLWERYRNRPRVHSE